jgi:ribosomal protein S18 acetylase RimI-like enzyme
MPQNVEIRGYQPGDGSICHGLRRSAFLGVFSQWLSAQSARIGAESLDVGDFERQLSTLQTSVATIGGRVVGFCTTRMSSPTRAEILYLYIDSRYHGMGIGAQLVRRAEQRLIGSHRELTSFYMDTAVPDYNRGFWERMGYRYVGPSTCRYPNGEISAVRLEKPVGGWSC